MTAALFALALLMVVFHGIAWFLLVQRRRGKYGQWPDTGEAPSPEPTVFTMREEELLNAGWTYRSNEAQDVAPPTGVWVRAWCHPDDPRCDHPMPYLEAWAEHVSHIRARDGLR